MAKKVYSFIAYRMRSGGYYIAIKDAAVDSKPVGSKLSTAVMPEVMSSRLPESNTNREQKNVDLEQIVNGGGAPPPARRAAAADDTDDIKGKAPGFANRMGAAALKNFAADEDDDAAALKHTHGGKDIDQKKITQVRAAAPLTSTTHEMSIDAMLAGGDPIAMFSEPGDDDRHPGGELIGNLILMEPTSPDKANTIHDDSPSDRFQIVYMRPDPASSDERRQTVIAADDAAVIVRTFMLARIAVARMEMRDVLQELARRRHRTTSLAASPVGSYAGQRLLARLDEGHGHAHRHFAARRRRNLYPLAVVESRLAGWTKDGRDAVQRYKGAVLVLGAVLFAWLLAWVWIPYLGNYQYEARGSAWLFAGLGAGAVFFLVNALNLKSIGHRLEEKVHERAVEKLRAILESMVQTNANVAALNLIVPFPGRVNRAIPPESLLERMDGALKVRDRFNSIAAVIKARQAHVVDGAKHIEEHRDRVRRSIAAAGSGVFVGFFTYEVGESIMSYLHVTHQQDSSAMFYWLAANGERIRARGAAQAHGHADSGTVAHAPALHPEFVAAYHKPELYAHSWLLTITIIVSALTAWIAMRKPAAEQAGGHGHH